MILKKGALAASLLTVLVTVAFADPDVKEFSPPAPTTAKPKLAVGPDAFGYTAADETEATGTPFNFIDISATGTATGLSGDDAGTAPLPIGFTFNLYGTDYTQVAASTNGYLNFNTAGDLGDFGNDCPGLNAFDPDQSIYVLWDDLFMGQGDDFYYQTFPACPNAGGGTGACTVFMWDNVRHNGGNEPWDMQAILYDNNNILIQVAEGNPETGSGSTTGIENQTPSSIGLDYACNTAGSIPDNRSVLFCAPGNTCPASDVVIPVFGPLGLLLLSTLLAGLGFRYGRKKHNI